MANPSLFRSFVGSWLPAANTTNEAGGVAYQRSPHSALATYAATGCLNDTYYASAETQLADTLALCQEIEPEFLARVALFSRQQAYRKDFPALLAAVLSVRSPGLLAEIFDRVIDSPKMLRTFVQIVRSGVVGRKSLGTLPKRLILQWLENRSDDQLLIGSVGQSPSLADIIKMVHPRPATASRDALYGYLLGRAHDAAALPLLVRQFESFKRSANHAHAYKNVPDLPFQLLTGIEIHPKVWKQIAKNASWQTTRMNLNTFLRHGVFADPQMINLVAERLRDPQAIAAAKIYPYQLMAAFMNIADEMPRQIRESLGDAMEIAIENVPAVNGKVIVCPDVSGSMRSSISGFRAGATSKVRCVDVAALVAAAILRRNPQAEILPFESNVVKCRLNARDTVMTNAAKLSGLAAGGTNCSAPLADLNRRGARGDLVVYVSDNESWLDSPAYGQFGGSSATETMRQWQQFKARNPRAVLVCIDIQPYPNAQVTSRDDIIQVAGFSDQVFRLLADVARQGGTKDYWVNQIQQIRI